MGIETTNGGTMITGTDIACFRLLQLRAALRVEMRGLKFRGGSVLALVKREFGLKGNRASVYAQFTTIVTNATGVEDKP